MFINFSNNVDIKAEHTCTTIATSKLLHVLIAEAFAVQANPVVVTVADTVTYYVR